MFVLEGIKNKFNIEDTIEGLIGFVNNQMGTENFKDYCERKFIDKGSKKLCRVGFTSLTPLKLELLDEVEWENASDELLQSNNYFHPLFFSMNITNGQYRKMYGEGSQYLYKSNNTNSFSDYFITRKVFESIGEGILKYGGSFSFEVDKGINQSTIKYQILEKFYEAVQQSICPKIQNGDYEGIEFFLDFNSIVENPQFDEKEKVDFIQRLLHENQLNADVRKVMDERLLNAMIYMAENIFFQTTQIFKIKLTSGLNNINALLTMKVDLPFEVPTAEKPTLKNRRNHNLDKNEPYPKLTLFEMILMRFLVVLINKQGSTDGSGFTFEIKEDKDEVASIEKHIQVISDSYGNMSIRKVEFEDVFKNQRFIRRIQKNGRIYLGIENEALSQKEWLHLFEKELFKVCKNFCIQRKKDEEKIWLDYRKKKYKAAGKKIYDCIFRNIHIRAYVKVVADNTLFQENLKSLLFVMDVLQDNQKNEGLLRYFMTYENDVNKSTEEVNTAIANVVKENTVTNGTEIVEKKKVNDYASQLMEKEWLTNEESCFLLGKITGLVLRNAKHKEKLIESVLKKTRVTELLEFINKRFEIEYGTIDYKGVARGWMLKNYQNSNILQEKRSLTPNEKFVFITGLLSEVGLNTKKVAQEGK